MNFFLVTLFSLIIGLAQKHIHLGNEEKKVFGTDRTFTFIGILGYILYIIDPDNLYAYMGGGLALTVILSIFYFRKTDRYNEYGTTTIIVALITYCLAPLIITQSKWLVILIVVTVLIFSELKESLLIISKKFDKDEFTTLAKFLVIAGVILPIVPDEQYFSYLPLTPYKVWLAVVVISSISYLSYLLKKFVFKDAGILLSGILGGMYSSTATTVILSKKSKNSGYIFEYTSGILYATGMMYFRILIIMAIFNQKLAIGLLPYFIGMGAISFASGYFIYRQKNGIENGNEKKYEAKPDKNPLEFRMAFIFTILYVVFTYVTFYTINNFGNIGLNILSLIVGITDIDPFLINLFQGKYAITETVVALVSMQAIIGNNLMKWVYTLIFANNKVKKLTSLGFIIIIGMNILLILLLYFIR
ncbi:MAG: DUF4010 domain-containing protein [Bacteroidota bacterium]|nr:DUF4010 domain-containing protein [Bacteroidota bacterium]